MERIKEILLETFNPMLAGIMISIGCLVNLSCGNKYIGAILFSVGLLTIIACQFDLFTGKVGYINDKDNDLLFLISVWCGNYLGVLFSVILIKFTKLNILQSKALNLVQNKFDDSLISLFILGMFCGLLMFVAIHVANSNCNSLMKIILIIFCVSSFILIGFEHCVADMFYFAFANQLGTESLVRLIVISIGNGVGANIISVAKRLK